MWEGSAGQDGDVSVEKERHERLEVDVVGPERGVGGPREGHHLTGGRGRQGTVLLLMAGGERPVRVTRWPGPGRSSAPRAMAWALDGDVPSLPQADGGSSRSGGTDADGHGPRDDGRARDLHDGAAVGRQRRRGPWHRTPGGPGPSRGFALRQRSARRGWGEPPRERRVPRRAGRRLADGRPGRGGAGPGPAGARPGGRAPVTHRAQPAARPPWTARQRDLLQRCQGGPGAEPALGHQEPARARGRRGHRRRHPARAIDTGRGAGRGGGRDGGRRSDPGAAAVDVGGPCRGRGAVARPGHRGGPARCRPRRGLAV